MHTFTDPFFFTILCSMPSRAFEIAKSVDLHAPMHPPVTKFIVRDVSFGHDYVIDLTEFIVEKETYTIGIAAALMVLAWENGGWTRGYLSGYVLSFVALLMDRGVSFEGVRMKWMHGTISISEWMCEFVATSEARALNAVWVSATVARITGLRETIDDGRDKEMICARRWRDAPLVLSPDKRWRRFFARDGDGAIWSMICSLF